MHEEELQHKIESGIAPGNKDEKAYRLVFIALKKEPDIHLVHGLADRVLRRMQGQSTVSEMVWLVAGLLAFMIAGAYAVYVTEFQLDFGALTFISGYKGLLIFAVVFLIAIQWVDKRLLKKSVG